MGIRIIPDDYFKRLPIIKRWKFVLIVPFANATVLGQCGLSVSALVSVTSIYQKNAESFDVFFCEFWVLTECSIFSVMHFFPCPQICLLCLSSAGSMSACAGNGAVEGFAGQGTLKARHHFFAGEESE